MTKRVAGRIAAASIAALAAAAFATPAQAQKIENQYICVFKPDAVAKGRVKDKASAAARANNGQVFRTYQNTIRGFAARISAQGAANMKAKNPNIAYCEQDQVATIVQRGKKGGGGGGSTPEQTPWGITRVNGGVSGASGTAFVIDSGIDASHPDLNIDTAKSANFTREKSWDDANGHGTHVAGTIGAIDNDIGVIGVAAGAKVAAVKVLDRRGSGAYSGVIAGVEHVGTIGRNGDVANMSLGGPPSQALDDAIKAASGSVKFTLAAGNESQDTANVSPARTEGPNIYTVSAMDSNNRFASFSNYGDEVDYAEPGVSVLSTYKGDGYATLSGTSMAAPHLAGLLLLGSVRSDGTVIGDPDGRADPIGVR